MLLEQQTQQPNGNGKDIFFISGTKNKDLLSTCYDDMQSTKHILKTDCLSLFAIVADACRITNFVYFSAGCFPNHKHCYKNTLSLEQLKSIKQDP